MDENVKAKIIDIAVFVLNDCIGDIIDDIFGYKALIKWKRIVVSMPSILPQSIPKWINIKNEKINNVKCRIYEPKEKKSNRLIIYIHGGGWAILRPRDFDCVLLPIIEKEKCMAISIDYSRSPEHTYPVAVNECWDVCDAVLNKSALSKYNINPDKITIMGDSAGGSMAAVVCQRAIKSGNRKFYSQILIYPCTNMIDYQTHSQLEFYHKGLSGDKFLTPVTMARYGLMYLGVAPTKEKILLMNENRHICEEFFKNEEFRKCYNFEYLPDEYKLYTRLESKSEITSDFLQMKKDVFQHLLDPDFSPLFSSPEIFQQMPRSFVLTANDDILRDDGLMYGTKINHHGGNCLLRNYIDARHGCMNLPFNKHKEYMISDIIDFLKELPNN
ncbi:Alpha/beta hydrolase fold-3 domain-containing protein [Strongyloides ratti]|uniref:Alpha/beta hydrolase fold-3 domain-containing protein n=1 Tax=Strongyloides ratti TaxID=34506 RepID=A0A090L0M3_STRRB|nr:Alpha/beta hydrolase fold-3 domain-containing protein [Strongyloides ratti]CEF63320.1 Alpha/beta hydrolase fold-3 domain-containing protein [Strongyloides ratti]